MAQFLCRTQNNSEAQGKPNVYFACHEDDRELYFEQVARDILLTQNCAVYCLDPQGADVEIEDIAAELSEMQLFVVPVTRRLMQRPNRAYLDEIPFALEHNIPVLPILEESGLDNLFSHRFGDMQFLDPNAADDTALGYHEKLRRYLGTVLVNDEVVRRIRSEFDAYIFLSYRKKDRAYAQRLMRTIHEIDFCRDIAIWYDEFLTPGEDFNRSIRTMLDQSRLFTLVVTPNLVNEINYIMQYEYPMAQRSGKAILPAEMEPTDRAMLGRYYRGMPAVVDTGDGEALRQRLWSSFADIIRSKKPPTAEHDYYIGLAYLSGIDVEINQERALRLITSAANAGCYEAARRMVAMYRNGDGVRRDYQKSAMMQARAAQILEERCRENPTEADTRRLIESYRDCGTAFYDAKDFQSAEKAFVKLYRLCRRYRSLHPAEYLDRELAIALYMLGDVRRSVYDYELAERYYDKAVALCHTLIDNYGKKTDHVILSLCYDRLGDIARDQNQPDTAERYYRRALELDRAFSTPRNCAVSLDKLGSIAEQRGNLSLAEERYAQSRQIREEIADAAPTALALSDLAHSLELLGTIACRNNRTVPAEEYYRRSLELRERVARDTESPAAKESLAGCYGLLGDLAYRSNNAEGARGYYEQSMELLQTLAHETGIPSARLNLALALEKRGSLALEEGDTEQAQTCFERSLALCEGLARRAKTVQTMSRLAAALTRMGEVSFAKNEIAAAEEYYQKARRIIEALDVKSAAVSTRLSLGHCYELLGTVEQQRGNLNKAEYYYTKYYELSRALDDELGIPDAKFALMGSYERLGSVAYAKNNPSAAWRLYDEAAKIALSLSKSEESESTRQFMSRSFEKLRRTQMDLANLYMQLGHDAMNAGNYTKAELLFQNAADTAEAIRDAGDRSVAAGNCCFELGRAKAAAGETAEAVYCFMKSAEHRREAARLHPDAGALFKLAQSHEATADLFLSDRRYDSAEKSLREALRLSRQIDAHYGEEWARKNAVNLNDKLGECLRRRGDLNGAINAFVDAVNLRGTLSDGAGAADSRRALCLCYRDAARHFESQGNFQNAQAYYLAAVNTYAVLVREQALLDDRRALAECHELLGAAYKAQRNQPAARNSYTEAVALRRAIYRETGEKSDKEALAAAEKAARRAR